MEHPPQIDRYEVTHKCRMRFTVLATTAGTNITFQNMLDMILIATSAVAGVDLFDLVRIRSVECWGQAALGTPNTISINFNSTTGDQSLHTDTSLGVKPAHVLAIPSNKSLASFWQPSAGGNAFRIACVAGSVLDISLSFKTSSNAPTAPSSALVGATTGELYFRGADGLATATTNFPPITGVQVQ
jgi:hypothetical protein